MRRLLRPATWAAGLVALALPAQAQGPILEHGVAILQGLDKVTARVSPVHEPRSTSGLVAAGRRVGIPPPQSASDSSRGSIGSSEVPTQSPWTLG